MSKIKIAEIFHSLQGEGLYLGVPSIFIRTFGCNFKCAGFGMLEGKSIEADKIAEQYKVHPEWRYEDLPLAKTGCDSYASWHPKFKSLSPSMGIDQIIEEVEIARCKTEPKGIDYAIKNSHIVITGGEPLLGWQKSYPELLDKLAEQGYRHITFETNGTQDICDELHDYLMLNHISGKRLDITFSVSPKMANSGEDINKALRPSVVKSYEAYGTTYLKFVIGANDDLANVSDFILAYRKAGFTGEIYFMPCGGDPELYNANAKRVAEFAMFYGVRYSPRLQVSLWGNAWST